MKIEEEEKLLQSHVIVDILGERGVGRKSNPSDYHTHQSPQCNAQFIQLHILIVGELFVSSIHFIQERKRAVCTRKKFGETKAPMSRLQSFLGRGAS